MRRTYLAAPVLVAAIVGFRGASSQATAAPATRATWEYKAVSFQQGVDPDNPAARGVKLFEDGQPIATSSVAERANQLGAQGWEMVSIAATENKTYRVHVYWFKRPRQ